MSQAKIHYTHLGVSSDLWLTHCGHLAVRVDEWPADAFAWPVHVPRDQHGVLDVWCASLTGPGMSDSALHVNVAPPKPPPHALGTSSMAHSLAASAVHPSGVCESLQDGSSLLRCGRDSTSPSRRCAEDSLPSPDGGDHVGLFGGDVCEGSPGAGQVHQERGHVPARERPQEVRSGRCASPDLRPMRSSLGSQAERGGCSSHSKVQPKCKDSSGHTGPRQGPGQSQQGEGASSATSTSYVPRFIAALGSLFSLLAIVTGGPESRLSLSSPTVEAIAADFGRGHEHGGRDDSLVASTGRFCGHRRERGRVRVVAGESEPLGRERGPTLMEGKESTAGRGGATGRRQPGLQGSPDSPLQAEHRHAFVLRKGVQKRLLGQVRSANALLATEFHVTHNSVQQARRLRKHQYDLIEIYGGTGNISQAALQAGLRVLQPIDHTTGVDLRRGPDHDALRQLLVRWKPYLAVWEPPCTAWSPLQRLNRTQEEIRELQREEEVRLNKMVDTILELWQHGCHFAIEDPAFTKFWKHPRIRRLGQLPGVHFAVGSMCSFGLTGRAGGLIRKNTG